jgi:hypothetical protein
MKVNKSSWHYKVHTVFGVAVSEKPISVCSYWSSVVTAPAWYAVLIATVVLLSPFFLISWLWEKYGPAAPKCPYGNVEFVDKEKP